MNQYIAHFTSLKEHIKNVQTACKRFELEESQIEAHDQSKFSLAEFDAYANYFYYKDGTLKDPKHRSVLDEFEFAKAWKHHIHHNPHHWQHWILE